MLMKATYFGSYAPEMGDRRPVTNPTPTTAVPSNNSSFPPATTRATVPTNQRSSRPVIVRHEDESVPRMNHPHEENLEQQDPHHRHSHGHRHCHWHRHHYRRHQQQQKLDQAHRVADLIGSRSFEGQMMGSTLDARRDTMTYSLLLGGATFIAVAGLASATGLRRPLGNFLGRRMAHITLMGMAGVAAGTISNRYQEKHQTLNDLKVMGTYLSPQEPSPSADALCQHPIIVQALADRQSEVRESPTARLYRSDSDWTAPSTFGGPASTDRKILTEFEQVLNHCQARRQELLVGGNPTVVAARVVEPEVSYQTSLPGRMAAPNRTYEAVDRFHHRDHSNSSTASWSK